MPSHGDPFPPDGGQGGPSYGRETLASLRRQVEGKRYDALFFKFCFVDFRDKRLKDEKTKKETWAYEGEITIHGVTRALKGDASVQRIPERSRRSLMRFLQAPSTGPLAIGHPLARYSSYRMRVRFR